MPSSSTVIHSDTEWVITDNAVDEVRVFYQEMAYLGNTNGSDYLQTINRLSEFTTPQAKAEARQNLELQDIDCGTFN